MVAAILHVQRQLPEMAETDSSLGTILVVGGSGYLGSHIVKRLLDGNHARSIAITSRNPKCTDERVLCYSVDITSPTSVKSLFETMKPQVVIHTVSPDHLAPLVEQNSTNVEGTRNLIEAAKACTETKAFVYTSSDSACQPSPHKQITEEQCELWNETTFNNPYGRSKAIADAMVLAANGPQLNTASLRVPILYGDGDKNFVAQTVASIRKGQHVYQMGDNTNIFEYVYVESAAYAHILAAKALLSNTPGADGQAYFITDDMSMPFFNFYRKACAAANHPVRKEDIKTTPIWVVKLIASLGEWIYWIGTMGRISPSLRRQDINHLDGGCFWSIEKAKRVLGYEPVLGQDEALELSMDWGMKNSK